MEITAKYPGKCATCGRSFPAGARIEWAKGEGSRHPLCARAGPPAPEPPPRRSGSTSQTRQSYSTPPPRRPSYPTTAPEPGAHEISSRRTGRGDQRYSVGDTIHGPKVAFPGGGPDGHYYTVLAAVMSGGGSWGEDQGEYGWTEHAWVRAATDAEAAPIASRVSVRENREALRRALDQVRPVLRVNTSMPPDAAILVPRNANSMAASGERIAITATGDLLHERVGDPDMSDSWHHYVVMIPSSAGGYSEMFSAAQSMIDEARLERSR